ncbi:MAG: outer membrane protein assembly factor BamC [Rhizobacter sp.]
MIRFSIRFPLSSLATATALVCTLSACSSLDGLATGDKIDYRTNTKTKATPLEVPPDLTQLAVDPRYAPQAGVISAATLQGPATAASAPVVTNVVAPAALGDVRLERQGNNLRYLSTNIPADQLWPQLQEFWKERGLALDVDQPEFGVMETVWAENRAKLSDDIIRRTVGRVFSSLYDTGERDRYRLRVERTERGTDIYLTHRGMEEVYTSQLKDNTTWKPRASDPLLEGEMLSRLMVKLGAKAEVAKAALAQQAATSSSTASTAPRARALTDRPAATLQMDESFDRAWRRVGLALDRSGFTVEDRDRAQGLYFVRYVDPAQAGKEEPGFFAKLFTDAKLAGPIRYRVNVKAEGDVSTVSVYDAKGQPEKGDAAQRIVKLLVDDLK